MESQGASAAKTIKTVRYPRPELSRNKAPQGSHGVPLRSWSSTGPAEGSRLRRGLELLSLHSRLVERGPAHSAWQGPVN